MYSESLLIAACTMVAVAMITAATLKAWQGWLALKARELESRKPDGEIGNPSGMARIEIADLKERIRKLEAIAAGVDL
ncbi:MAG: hypothetical protein O9283_11640 [Sphingomonadaceae bacterium]|nr:hypothetical protein [Sphingomonadaceae bacterium]